MNDIHVFTGKDEGSSSGEQKLFYSRRSGGPYYCWYYLSGQSQWKAIRLQPHSKPRVLRKAVGRNLPVSLQTRLREHYLA
jgi:hypothetical protein